MLKFSKFALLSALLVAAASAQAADEKTAAIVNGVAIPQDRVEFLVKANTQQGAPDSPNMRKQIRDNLVELEIISQAATKEGLNKNTDVIQQLEIARQNILATAYFRDYAKNHPVGDDAVKQAYETWKAGPLSKEYKLSHILVATEAEAKKIEAKLKKKGANFGKIAKQYSKDAGSKDKGGRLGDKNGWASLNGFVRPFGEAVLKLSKGQISEPVQTQFGWHIIKLDDVKDANVSFDQIKPSIEKTLQQQAIQKQIEDLRSTAKVE